MSWNVGLSHPKKCDSSFRILSDCVSGGLEHTSRDFLQKRFGSMKHAEGPNSPGLAFQIFRRRLDFNVCYGHFSSIAVGFVDCVAYRVVFFDDLQQS